MPGKNHVPANKLPYEQVRINLSVSAEIKRGLEEIAKQKGMTLVEAAREGLRRYVEVERAVAEMGAPDASPDRGEAGTK